MIKGDAKPGICIPIAKPFVGIEELHSVANVLASGWLVQGPKARTPELDLCAVAKLVAVTVSTLLLGDRRRPCLRFRMALRAWKTSSRATWRPTA